MCDYCEVAPSGEYVDKDENENTIIIDNRFNAPIVLSNDAFITYIRRYSNACRDRYYLVTESNHTNDATMVEIFFCPMCGREFNLSENKIIPFKEVNDEN